MSSKVQFKVMLRSYERELIRQHAAMNELDMSATISVLVRDVILPELPADRVEAARKAAPE